jgi:hypothetical protein
VNLILDAGALIALDRRDRNIEATLRIFQQTGTRVRTSAAVVAQVWRNGARQANLTRHLDGVDLKALDGVDARSVGELLRRSKSSDIVDGHLASLIEDGDTILTGDIEDLMILLDARGVRVSLLRV